MLFLRDKEGFRPAVAWALLVFIILGSIAAIAINDRTNLHRRIPFEMHPEALVARSREIIKKAGYTDKFADSAYGLARNSFLLSSIEKSDKTPSRWKNLDAKAILFWYRQSPRPLEPSIPTGLTIDSPALKVPGEVEIVLDTEGRLVSFLAVPPQVQSSDGNALAPDWTLFFAEASLDQSQWTPTNAQWLPPFFADIRAAWQSSVRNQPRTPVRIEAAAFQGKAVSFEIIYR